MRGLAEEPQYTEAMAYGIGVPDVIAVIGLGGALYVTYLYGRLLRSR